MIPTQSVRGFFVLVWLFVAGTGLIRAKEPVAEPELNAWLERLRKENPGEYDKVKLLLEKERAAAIRFLLERYGTKTDKPIPGPVKPIVEKPKPVGTRLPARTERFIKLETLQVGEFAIDLCKREDGAFGLGEIRHGKLPLRRADFLITWQVNGKFPAFERRDGLTVSLRNPPATLTLAPEKRESTGMTFRGFRITLKTERGPVVETASWELAGSTKGLDYFDGYRGWHGPPIWQKADGVPSTNPKLQPALLQGTGFQFLHGKVGALLHFHTTPGDRLNNASRGEALEFQTTFSGPSTIDRYVFVAKSERDSRVNLWTRGFEVAHAELRRVLRLPERPRDVYLQWPPFSRKGFRETARECAAITERDGFTGASIDVIWDNADFHGGAKNMNVWDYVVCPGYGGEDGLKSLMDECKKQNLLVTAWVPAGHLASASPLWQKHPDWVLKNQRGETFKNPSGLWHGALDTGFHDYFRDRVTGVVRKFGLHGLWLDTHLSYAQQSRPADHTAKLTALYRDFIKAGARNLLVEGDASALGAYGIGIGDDWEKEWGKMPAPELYYGAILQAGSMEPRFYLSYLRRYVASGAMWVINWDFLYSPKLTGDDVEAARREIRRVVQDYRKVKDKMIHRFVHDDGSGYTWTNDKDATKVVWLLKDAPLPDGRRGKAGEVYEIKP